MVDLFRTEASNKCVWEYNVLMEEELIAACGMNCGLCIAYQFKQKDLNTQGFHRRYCPGCIPRGENCVHMADACELVGKGLVRFCFECQDYPCTRLKNLDKRYSSKYHMSMIENLDAIKENGMQAFLEKQEEKWRCPTCGGTICCHNGLCFNCDLETFLQNKKHRWNEQ